MMNYELFKELATKMLSHYISDNCPEYELESQTVFKVNRKLDGIYLRPKDEKNQHTAATIYLNDMYDHYQRCNNLEEVLQEAFSLMKNTALPDTGYPFSIEQAKNNVIMQLINTEQNIDMLKNLPHRKIQDLSIIYRWMIDDKQNDTMSTIINFPLSEKLGMPEDELYSSAMVNTKRLLPPTVLTMNEVIKKIMADNGVPDGGEVLDEILGWHPNKAEMYVISNEKGIWGAVSMLFEDVLYNLAEKFNSNLYILPSSIHEVLAISTNGSDVGNLADTVIEINMAEVPLEDRLSNQVYYYDRKSKTLSLATDINKSLDGMAAESNGS